MWEKARLLLRRDLTLANLTDRLARVYGDRVAFVMPSPSAVTGQDSTTFEGVARAVGRLSAAITRSGIEPGEHVAIIPSNGCDFLLSVLAVARAGAVAVPINPALKAPEVGALIELSGVRSVVLDKETAKLVPDVIERRMALGKVRGAVDLVTEARRVEAIPDPAPRSGEQVAAVLYTSGTTGRPKGARLTGDGLIALAARAALNPGTILPRVSTALTALPQAHIMGLAVSLMFLHAGVEHAMYPRFDAPEILDAIERRRPDVFVGVPAMYRAMLDAGAEERDLTSVKVWSSAADAMPVDLARRFQSFGRLVGSVRALFVEAYGMVELSGAALLRIYPPGFPSLAPSAIAIPPYSIRVVDSRGRAVRRGETGELCVKGPGVLEGYQGDPATTRAVIRDGWLRTGDLARLGLIGGVTLVGRKKDVVKVGGYSVFPVEVEEEIRRHPKVAEAAVVGLPDERLGSVTAAAVVPAPGRTLDAGELDSWAKDAIAAYRRPRKWLVVKSLPRGATRKVDKQAVSAMFARGVASGRTPS